MPAVILSGAKNLLCIGRLFAPMQWPCIPTPTGLVANMEFEGSVGPA